MLLLCVRESPCVIFSNSLLLLLGEWMNKSAGLAFTPHVIHITIGEVCAMLIFLLIYRQLHIQIYVNSLCLKFNVPLSFSGHNQ